MQNAMESGAAMDARTLHDEWRAANDHCYTLERREKDIEDKAECLDLPSPCARSLRRCRPIRTSGTPSAPCRYRSALWGFSISGRGA